MLAQKDSIRAPANLENPSCHGARSFAHVKGKGCWNIGAYPFRNKTKFNLHGNYGPGSTECHQGQVDPVFDSPGICNLKADNFALSACLLEISVTCSLGYVHRYTP